MAAVTIGFRWLDILEKEFDKAFVDLEVLVGDVCEYEEGEIVAKAQHRLQSLSSCFAQLTHKAQTIFQNNAKLEAELVHLRKEVAESRGQVSALKEQLHLPQHNAPEGHEDSTTSECTTLLNDDETEVEVPTITNSVSSLTLSEEVSLLHQENTSLRRLMLRLQGELCGARLAAKYLDKELAGRIQQLQLLGRETRWQQQQDKLWRQLEAEINLHRHKTVVRACRANIPARTGMQTECRTANLENNDDASEGTGSHLHDDQPRPRPQHYERTVVIQKQLNQNLGMSVTGGREHGVPIVVSVVHPNTPASDCSVYVGDAILAVNGQDLSTMNHSAAVTLLSRPAETVTLQLLFVPPESDETGSNSDDPFTFKYGLFDDDVVSVTSSSCSVVPRLYPHPPPALDTLSRASVDSVRGSCDNLLAVEGLDGSVEGKHSGLEDAPAKLNCSVETSCPDVQVDNEIPLQTFASLSNSHSDHDGRDCRLPPPNAVGSVTVKSGSVTADRQETLEYEHGSSSVLPVSLALSPPKQNSNPPTPVHRKHSLSNAGMPSTPLTPVHRKNSSYSTQHKASYSRSTSLMNPEQDISASSVLSVRSKSIPTNSFAYNAPQNLSDNISPSRTTDPFEPDVTPEISTMPNALPFSRQTTPSGSLLNSSGVASAASAPTDAANHLLRMPFQKQLDQKMTVL